MVNINLYLLGVNIRKGGIRTHTKLMNHLANYKQYYQEDGQFNLQQ